MIGKADLVLKLVDYLCRDKKYIEAVKVLQREYDWMGIHAPEGTKRLTFGLDIVLLSLLLEDKVLAEQWVAKVGNE